MTAPLSAWDALAMRRTAKAFANRVPSRKLVERLIQAATWAPNHRLTEPWRFVVLAGEERARFGDHLAAAMAAQGGTEKKVASTRVKPLRSPVVVVVAQHRPASDTSEGASDGGTASVDDVQDREDYAAVACATQNLLLAATAEGLASKWSTGAMAEMPEARAYLGLGAADRIVGYVYLGYPTTDPATDAPAAHTASPASRRPPQVSWRGLP